MNDRFGWIGGLIGFLMVLLTIWGTYWSFHRYGPGHGVASILFIPYAWYRGAAYFWEEPEWKEYWDEKTETIGAIVAMSVSEEKDIDIIKYKDRIRKWIKTIPKSEQDRLRNATISFGDAMIQYSRNLVEDMTIGKEIRPITHPNIQEFTQRFYSVSGLRAAWKQIESQDALIQETGNRMLVEATPEGRFRLLKSRDLLILYADSNAQIIHDTIKDLFRQN